MAVGSDLERQGVNSMKWFTLGNKDTLKTTVLCPFVYFQQRWQMLAGRDHLRASHSAWSLVLLPPKHTHRLPTGNLCRHPLPSCSRKLQSIWLGHCQECPCGNKSRGCSRLSWLKTVYPSTVSYTPALELAISLVSMNKSSFQSSDAPITLFANVQVPCWGTDVGFGAL